MVTSLEELRVRLDSVDQRILELLKERQTLVREVGALKARDGQSIVQPDRERAIYQMRREQGERLELDPSYVEALWRVIHEESCRQQGLVREALVAKSDAGVAATGPANQAPNGDSSAPGGSSSDEAS